MASLSRSLTVDALMRGSPLAIEASTRGALKTAASAGSELLPPSLYRPIPRLCQCFATGVHAAPQPTNEAVNGKRVNMLTAEIIRGKNRCTCAQCVRCYEAAIAAQADEQRQLEELRDEMNRAGLDLVQTIADTTAPVIERSREPVVRQIVGGKT